MGMAGLSENGQEMEMFGEWLRIGNATNSKHLYMVLSIGPCIILSLLYRTLREMGANMCR